MAVQQARRVTGMGLMACAMLLVPGADVIAKVLMERLSPTEVTTGRFLAQTLVLLPLAMSLRQVSRPTVGHAAAGLFRGLAMWAFNAAIQVMPVANALAIFFVEPLILTLLAWLALKERVGSRRLAAILVGLAGALLVLRPNVSTYGSAALFPLAAAALFACYLLTTRMMSLRGGPLTPQFWTGVFAAIALAVCMAALTPEAVDGRAGGALTSVELSLFLALGLLAAFAHQRIVRALALVEAGAAAPLQYLELVSATLLGWLVFAEFPDAPTWLGAAIIISAGVYVFRRG